MISTEEGQHRVVSLEQLIEVFEPGTVLWRACKFDARNRPYLERSEFRMSDRGNRYTARVLIDRASFFLEPTIQASRPRRDQVECGIIVMLDEQPPERWTHLICGGIGAKRTSIRAYYDGTQLDAADYLEFRERARDDWYRTARMPIGDRMAGASRIEAGGLRPEARRIIAAFDSRQNRFLVEEIANEPRHHHQG